MKDGKGCEEDILLILPSMPLTMGTFRNKKWNLFKRHVLFFDSDSMFEG